VRTYRVGRLIEQKTRAMENRTTARDLYDVHFLAKHFRVEFEPEAIARLRMLTADINRLEGRFRPAFEEDDLFRERTELVASLILELQAALG
jgi:predicted nucleotidyltransferase component of viral defense system